MLTQPQQIEVVLVSPRNPLNIGAVARAMANFGLTHLTVVAPYAPHWREARSAIGAPELLLNARETGNLAEAVADCTFVAGTGTRTHRRPEQSVITLPDLPAVLAPKFASGGRIALVFGPEKHGLTRHDLSWCHALVEIPTDPRQPSMNLGQAVAVCVYELSRITRAPDQHKAAGLGGLTPFPREETEKMGHGAVEADSKSGMLDRLASLIEESMAAAGYSPRAMQPANQHDLRLMLRRLAPSSLDTRRIMGLFRRILYRLQNPPR